MAKKKNVDPAIIDLVGRMLQMNPNNRPSVDEIISHPAFKDVKL